MKEFDWEFCEKTRSPRVHGFLRNMYDKKCSEEDFVVWMKDIAKQNRKDGLYKDRNYKKYKRKLERNKLKRQYQSLREKFAFFPD